MYLVSSTTLEKNAHPLATSLMNTPPATNLQGAIVGLGCSLQFSCVRVPYFVDYCQGTNTTVNVIHILALHIFHFLLFLRFLRISVV